MNEFTETMFQFMPQGTVLPHEHPLSAGNNPSEVLRLLRSFRKRGGTALVDVTPESAALYRDTNLLLFLSEKANVKIFCSVGYYKEPYIPTHVRRKSANEIAEEFIHKIEVGVGGPAVHPIVIGEVGSSFNTITATERKILLAAAIAHRKTGLPIITHTTHGTMGLQQLDILEKAGADLTKVIVGHCDLNPDIKYHLELARRGANLGFDTVGKEWWRSSYCTQGLAYQSDEIRIKIILQLFEIGLQDKIILSLDMLSKERHLNPKTHGKFGYNYIFVFLKKLRKAGLSAQDCAALVTTNPQKILNIL